MATGIAIAGLAVSVGAEAAGGIEKEQQLRQEKTQLRLQAVEQKKAKDRQLQQILSAQTAAASARGIAPTSPTLATITNTTFDQFAEDRAAENLNLRIKTQGIKQQQNDILFTLGMGSGSNLMDFANQMNKTSTPSRKTDKTTQPKPSVGSSSSRQDLNNQFGNEFNSMGATQDMGFYNSDDYAKEFIGF